MRHLVVYHRTGILAIYSPRLDRNDLNQKAAGRKGLLQLFLPAHFVVLITFLQVLAHLCLSIEAVFDRSVPSQDIDDLFESPLFQCSDGN
ncbi:hypothetical protein SDC9_106100 [bioreactor metagenome]|uniref:Uncharacterized protein n=1 Tax=bioreactor metagenome TaxID=1076179 RepID=A0A645B1E2_9ZZZZ